MKSTIYCIFHVCIAVAVSVSTVKSGTVTYYYDDAHRLTDVKWSSATGATVAGYRFDPAHNLRTHTVVADADVDELPDWWELHYLEGTSGTDPGDDPDADSHTNVEEAIAGTDPGDSASVFHLGSAATGTDDSVTFTWPSSDGRYYAVEFTTNLLVGFTMVASNLVATPPENTFELTIAEPEAGSQGASSVGPDLIVPTSGPPPPGGDPGGGSIESHTDTAFFRILVNNHPW